ncbi:Oidioi.mRNA.OKI2018_I69.chr2.g4893.t1.cds [Oikopleura dioica]|uniref:Oidioi.mRNA.OKI2018_I69.chr2.g4893.t1.cds n=1 Tax=Oikopleura dioica TaxID=34765 RepID=A0ABN7T4F7_OIKDI|nr:Oidioi.mRNA.OKI2018_I69.chr2.g4893.t1.cds [Oikopleura dioica]
MPQVSAGGHNADDPETASSATALSSESELVIDERPACEKTVGRALANVRSTKRSNLKLRRVSQRRPDRKRESKPSKAVPAKMRRSARLSQATAQTSDQANQPREVEDPPSESEQDSQDEPTPDPLAKIKELYNEVATTHSHPARYEVGTQALISTGVANKTRTEPVKPPPTLLETPVPDSAGEPGLPLGWTTCSSDAIALQQYLEVFQLLIFSQWAIYQSTAAEFSARDVYVLLQSIYSLYGVMVVEAHVHFLPLAQGVLNLFVQFDLKYEECTDLEKQERDEQRMLSNLMNDLLLILARLIDFGLQQTLQRAENSSKLLDSSQVQRLRSSLKVLDQPFYHLDVATPFLTGLRFVNRFAHLTHAHLQILITTITLTREQCEEEAGPNQTMVNIGTQQKPEISRFLRLLLTIPADARAYLIDIGLLTVSMGQLKIGVCDLPASLLPDSSLTDFILQIPLTDPTYDHALEAIDRTESTPDFYIPTGSDVQAVIFRYKTFRARQAEEARQAEIQAKAKKAAEEAAAAAAQQSEQIEDPGNSADQPGPNPPAEPNETIPQANLEDMPPVDQPGETRPSTPSSDTSRTSRNADAGESLRVFIVVTGPEGCEPLSFQIPNTDLTRLVQHLQRHGVCPPSSIQPTQLPDSSTFRRTNQPRSRQSADQLPEYSGTLPARRVVRNRSSLAVDLAQLSTRQSQTISSEHFQLAYTGDPVFLDDTIALPELDQPFQHDQQWPLIDTNQTELRFKGSAAFKQDGPEKDVLDRLSAEEAQVKLDYSRSGSRREKLADLLQQGQERVIMEWLRELPTSFPNDITILMPNGNSAKDAHLFELLFTDGLRALHDTPGFLDVPLLSNPLFAPKAYLDHFLCDDPRTDRQLQHDTQNLYVGDLPSDKTIDGLRQAYATLHEELNQLAGLLIDFGFRVKLNPVTLDLLIDLTSMTEIRVKTLGLYIVKIIPCDPFYSGLDFQSLNAVEPKRLELVVPSRLTPENEEFPFNATTIDNTNRDAFYQQFVARCQRLSRDGPLRPDMPYLTELNDDYRRLDIGHNPFYVRMDPEDRARALSQLARSLHDSASPYRRFAHKVFAPHLYQTMAKGCPVPYCSSSTCSANQAAMQELLGLLDRRLQQETGPGGLQLSSQWKNKFPDALKTTKELDRLFIDRLKRYHHGPCIADGVEFQDVAESTLFRHLKSRGWPLRSIQRMMSIFALTVVGFYRKGGIVSSRKPRTAPDMTDNTFYYSGQGRTYTVSLSSDVPLALPDRFMLLETSILKTT